MKELKSIIEHVAKLEARLQKIESDIDVNKIEIKSKSNKKNEQSSKMQARLELMHQLREMYPSLLVSIAKRHEGGGLLLTNRSNKENYRLKFYRSKNYSSSRLFGWFSIRSKDVFESNNDLYALSVSFDNKNHLFIFDHQTLVNIIQMKKVIQREKNGQETEESIIHFYIEKQQQKYIETREYNQSLDTNRGKIEKGIDLTSSYNNFQVIEKVVNIKKSNNNFKFSTFDKKLIKNLFEEIFYQDLIIPLDKKYIKNSGNLMFYSEYTEFTETIFDKTDLSKSKRLIIYIEMNKDDTLEKIKVIKNNIGNLIDNEIELIISVALKAVDKPITKLFLFSEYQID